MQYSKGMPTILTLLEACRLSLICRNVMAPVYGFVRLEIDKQSALKGAMCAEVAERTETVVHSSDNLASVGESRGHHSPPI